MSIHSIDCLAGAGLTVQDSYLHRDLEVARKPRAAPSHCRPQHKSQMLIHTLCHRRRMAVRITKGAHFSTPEYRRHRAVLRVLRLNLSGPLGIRYVLHYVDAAGWAAGANDSRQNIAVEVETEEFSRVVAAVRRLVLFLTGMAGCLDGCP